VARIETRAGAGFGSLKKLVERLRRPDTRSLVYLSAAVVVLKLPTLRTPAYWDEMSWLGQADWLSEVPLWRALPGLRPDSIFFGHPPGLHLTAAVPFKLFGSSVELAHVLILGFAVLGIISTFLLARFLYDTTTAWVAALLLLLCPLFFAQSGMFLADVPVAALGVTSVYFALTRRYVPYLVCASYMVLLKETAVALVVALVLYLLITLEQRSKQHVIEALKYAAPLAVIGAFVLLQRITTGHFFSIYDFEFELFDPSHDSMRRQFELVTEWIFVNQFRWILTAFIAADLLWFGVRGRKDAWLFGLILLLSGYSFAGLYLLPRYLLPVFPFFFIIGANSLLRLVRAPRFRTAAAVAVVGAAAWVLLIQPFTGNGEVNLRYLDVVAAHETMANHIAARDPSPTVLTQWPHTDELAKPVLGYIDRRIRTKSYSRTRDVDGSDLIVVSNPPEAMEELKSLARRSSWPLVHTVRKGDITVELYERPGT
jgi:4-amino-4-deoxy-L-arabinose transferase-like glycosyltransferase